jgi:hypothetical protein
MITEKFNGQLSCSQRHDHGVAPFKLSYVTSNPLVVRFNLYAHSHVIDVPRDLALDCYGPKAGDDYQVYGLDGFITLKVRNGHPGQVVIRFPVDLGDAGVKLLDLLTPRYLVAKFLDRTLLAVARGAEESHLNLDACIKQILDAK